MNKIGNIKVESKNGNNIVNLYQVDNSVGDSPVQPKLEDFGIETKKGWNIFIKAFVEIVGCVASICTIASSLGLSLNIAKSLISLAENKENLYSAISIVAYIILAISIIGFRADFATYKHTVFGSRVYSSRTKRIYKLKMDKCPMCGRNSYPNIKPLDKTFFVLSCPKCGKEIKLSYSELMDFVERDN